MSFNNGPYIFSDVPGYEASKGERLVPSCNINMNMNNLGSTDIASEVVVSDTRDVEIADILVGMPAETVNVTCEVNEEQPLISLQPLLDATSQGIILQPQEEIVGADSESEGLSAYEHIPVSTSDVILDSSSGQANKRGRKGKKIGNKGKLTGEQLSENKRAARKWDRKQVQIKTLEAGIVKAFRKLWTKINHLEQAKILEKNPFSQEVQASSDTDLTINDIKYEILLTQLRYITKIVREYATDRSSNSLEKVCYETTTDFDPASSANNFRSMHEGPDVQYEDHVDSLPGSTISKISIEISHREERERNINDHQASTTGTQTSNKVNASVATEKLLQDHSKPDSHSHYHLKLDDVPFILGASSSASHSVVANVQNIIALMKSHNKALCAPKLQTQRYANSAKMHKADTQDANKMLEQLSEDLSKLAMKQERLRDILDNANASPHSSDAKVKATQHFDAGGEKKSQISNNAGDAGLNASTSTLQKNSKQPPRKKSGANFGNQEKRIVPTVRIQANEDPQLARRKMLRSLKDFKTHLSEEDLSWR